MDDSTTKGFKHPEMDDSTIGFPFTFESVTQMIPTPLTLDIGGTPGSFYPLDNIRFIRSVRMISLGFSTPKFVIDKPYYLCIYVHISIKHCPGEGIKGVPFHLDNYLDNMVGGR